MKNKQTEWRFDVIVNAELLVEYMTYNEMTVRDLADRVKCSRSTIGHYRTGLRRHCPSKRANLIAKALRTPMKPLFTPEPSLVTRDGRLKVSA
ncbi:hypothetical protein B2J88_07875 [Rhodococcus sp. SRB_17]|nr:hypothetical protein [Rhodococcus sp. SRB_17]